MPRRRAPLAKLTEVPLPDVEEPLRSTVEKAIHSSDEESEDESDVEEVPPRAVQRRPVSDPDDGLSWFNVVIIIVILYFGFCLLTDTFSDSWKFWTFLIFALGVLLFLDGVLKVLVVVRKVCSIVLPIVFGSMLITVATFMYLGTTFQSYGEMTLMETRRPFGPLEGTVPRLRVNLGF